MCFCFAVHQMLQMMKKSQMITMKTITTTVQTRILMIGKDMILKKLGELDLLHFGVGLPILTSCKSVTLTC